MANNNTFVGPVAGIIVSPAAQKMTYGQNYIDFTSSTTAGWAQQYLQSYMRLR